MEDKDFSALLCSRLCHDLISPVSAVSNGIELLDDEADPVMRDQVLELIKKSASQSSSMVQFYRAAFGAGGGLSDDVELDGVKALIADFASSKNTVLKWESAVHNLSKKQVKMVLNTVLLALESLVRGGELSIEITNSGDRAGVKILASGSHVILYPQAKKMLADGGVTDGVEARTTPVAIIFGLVDELQAEFSFSESDSGSINFTMNFPFNI